MEVGQNYLNKLEEKELSQTYVAQSTGLEYYNLYRSDKESKILEKERQSNKESKSNQLNNEIYFNQIFVYKYLLFINIF